MEFSRKVNYEDYYQVLRDVDELKEGMNQLGAEKAGLNAMSLNDDKPIVSSCDSN